MPKVISRAGWLLVLLAALLALPVIWVETSCQAPGPARQMQTLDLKEEKYKRAEGDSFLTFPEWYIVHAYADLAGVTRQSSESSFDYVSSVLGFWRSLCEATRTAGGVGTVTFDQKVTNHIIGASFTVEFAIKGLWERTVGALSYWTRGAARTAEDEFALKLLDDYAAFLRQTPWYQFPFLSELARFWRETPASGDSVIRKWERRLAMSLEYAGKALYAVPIGWLAGASPADLEIKSVVRGLDDADLKAEPRIERLRDLGDGLTLVRTPRYRAFTEIARGLGARGRSFVEIAGNKRILVTVLAPAGGRFEAPGAREIFSLDIQSTPGWRRYGLLTEVEALAALIGVVETQGAKFEHAYDY